jgi:hypothetical protein
MYRSDFRVFWSANPIKVTGWDVGLSGDSPNILAEVL